VVYTVVGAVHAAGQAQYMVDAPLPQAACFLHHSTCNHNGYEHSFELPAALQVSGQAQDTDDVLMPQAARVPSHNTCSYNGLPNHSCGPPAAPQVSGQAQYTDGVLLLCLNDNFAIFAHHSSSLRFAVPKHSSELPAALHCRCQARRSTRMTCPFLASLTQLQYLASDSTCDVWLFACLPAALQVSGQAQYTDDVPLPPNTLHAAFVTSSKPHAKLLKVRLLHTYK
jgi:hypothetical protein